MFQIATNRNERFNSWFRSHLLDENVIYTALIETIYFCQEKNPASFLRVPACPHTLVYLELSSGRC